MLDKLVHIDDFDRINPYALGIDDDYLRNIEADKEESQIDHSFVEELREYQFNLDSREPDFDRMVEILSELLTTVLDTQGSYILYRAILTIYHEKYADPKQQDSLKTIKPVDQNRAGYLQDLESSESYQMRSLSSKEIIESEKSTKEIFLKPFAHNTLSSNRKTLNVTDQSHSLLEVSKDHHDYDSRSVGHKR